MPETNLQGTEERFKYVVARKASIAYSDEFITEDLPSKELYIYRLPPVWPRKEDPFIQSGLLESLEGEEEEVQKLIYQVKTSPIRYREKLANRFFTLFKVSKEEDPYGPGISAESLRNFIKLLQSHSNLKLPSISLTPECNIYASWRGEQNRLFSIHFLPNGDVRFVIFKPNYKHPERKIRIAGTTTIDTLMETVSPHKISDWVSE